jgi:hypothetical protein
MNGGIQKSPIRQQHEFVFLLTPEFRQLVDSKFSRPKRTAVSTDFKPDGPEKSLSDPGGGKKTIGGMAMGPQPQKLATCGVVRMGIV